MQREVTEAKIDENLLKTLPELDKEAMDEFDIYLDGEVFKPVVTDIERKTKDEFKPVMLENVKESDKLNVIKNKGVLSKVLNLVIALVLDLNPEENFDPALYELRIAIIAVIMLSGCYQKDRNNNVKSIKKENLKDYYAEVIKNLTKNDKERIKRVIGLMNVAFNFLCFSVLNFVRFNHHFPVDKKHIMRKALNGMGEDFIKKYTDDNKMEAFYNNLVTAAKIVNDDLFFRTYLKVINRKSDSYTCIEGTGLMNLQVQDEIVKIRIDPTPNTFLIVDIIYQIIMDIKFKNLLAFIPNFHLYIRILEIRKLLKENPFAFHPSRLYHKYNEFNEEYERIRSEFLAIMENIGSFVYLYSERMFPSIASAKCRRKYEEKIRASDENVVKLIFDISEEVEPFNKEKVVELKKKLNVIDISSINAEDIKEKNSELSAQLDNVLK